MPSPGIYEAGSKLAEELVSSYRRRHGKYPDKLTFTLWRTEGMRHEGILEAEIMRLLGVKPLWDQRGRVLGVERLSRQELGRPRVDVVMLPSGLYRDLNAVLMRLLDQAATVARQADEPDNLLAANYQRTRAALMAQGVPETQAARMAGVRLFSTPTGAYGSGLDRVIRQSNTWQHEAQVVDTYFTRKSFAFGQGFWGDRDVSGGVTTGADQPMAPTLRVDLFKMALQGANASIISRSSNIYAALDNDDVYQELGGAAMAVRAANREAGSTSDAPEVLVLNLANPKDGKHETIDKFIGREMRSRYLNPEWIKAMLKEGYSGAGFVNKVVENLWGWQVTVPEAVDGAKWQELYETYVADRHGLEIEQKFRDAKNLLAYQGMIDRMLTAVTKGYWKADAATIEGLQRANRAVIAEAGVACDRDSCSSADITSLAEAHDRKIAEQAAKQPAPKVGARPPAAALAGSPQPTTGQSVDRKPTRSASAQPTPRNAAQPKSAAPAKPATVEGFEMTEQTRALTSRIVEVAPVWLLLLFGSILALGWLARRSVR
jgi:cobaltochelatase CobN